MITITLPLPHKILSPNARCHWAVKSVQTKKHRLRAAIEACKVVPQESRAKITGYALRFYFKTRQRRDDDNAAASCKAYRDGIADGLGIDDNRMRMVCAPEMLHDKFNPRLEIVLMTEDEIPKWTP